MLSLFLFFWKLTRESLSRDYLQRQTWLALSLLHVGRPSRVPTWAAHAASLEPIRALTAMAAIMDRAASCSGYAILATVASNLPRSRERPTKACRHRPTWLVLFFGLLPKCRVYTQPAGRSHSLCNLSTMAASYPKPYGPSLMLL